MSHSTVLVALPDAVVAKFGFNGALTDALAPFDENKEMPRYIELTKAEAIAKERERMVEYRDNGLYAEYIKDPAAYAERRPNVPDHIEYLRTGFPEKLTHLDDDDWLYKQATEWEDGNIDEDGNITSTRNPKSKWDWWTIGGRWTDAVLNAETVIHHPEKVMNEKYTVPAFDQHTGGVDYLRKRDLTSAQTTFAFLDADGEWHEQGRMGWFGMASNEKDPDAWGVEFMELLAKVDDDDWLVVVDVHI